MISQILNQNHTRGSAVVPNITTAVLRFGGTRPQLFCESQAKQESELLFRDRVGFCLQFLDPERRVYIILVSYHLYTAVYDRYKVTKQLSAGTIKINADMVITRDLKFRSLIWVCYFCTTDRCYGHRSNHRL